MIIFCVGTGFRPSGYIQAGDDAVYVTLYDRHICVKVKHVDKKTGLSLVDSGYGSFVVPTNTLTRRYG